MAKSGIRLSETSCTDPASKGETREKKFLGCFFFFFFFFLPDLSQLTNQTVMCVADPSLQSSYPAFVMYTSLIYKNMTTPVYTTLKGVSSALHCRTFTFIINSHTFMLHVWPSVNTAVAHLPVYQYHVNQCLVQSCRKPLCWAAVHSQMSHPALRNHLVQKRRTAPSAAHTPPPAPARTAPQAALALSKEVQDTYSIPGGFWE